MGAGMLIGVLFLRLLWKKTTILAIPLVVWKIILIFAHNMNLMAYEKGWILEPCVPPLL
jgi:hypothetical protein